MTMKRRPTYSITKELYLTNFMTEMGINYFMQMMQKISVNSCIETRGAS